MDVKRCAVCERTLLLGERAVRFAPEGNHEFVDVCQLCQDAAVDHGWVREGQPLGPAVGRAARRRRTLSLGGIFGNGHNRPAAAESIVAEPILRRLSDEEQTMVEAAALFNASDGVRTIEGIARSLGDPQVSIVRLAGSGPDVVVTLRLGPRLVPVPSQPRRCAAAPPDGSRHGAGRGRRELPRLERPFRDRDGRRAGSRRIRVTTTLDSSRSVRTMRTWAGEGGHGDLLRHSAGARGRALRQDDRRTTTAIRMSRSSSTGARARIGDVGGRTAGCVGPATVGAHGQSAPSRAPTSRSHRRRLDGAGSG